MKNTTRTHHQIACDGVQTIWLPNTPALRAEVERVVHKSIDGIVLSGTMRDIAMQVHKNDTLRAMGGRQRISRVHDTLTGFMATMDGVRVRRTAHVIA